MPEGLRSSYNAEITAYKTYLANREFHRAWRQLERAHILGQPWAIEHTQVHWLMLRFGFLIKDWDEILGQLPRLVIGGVKSYVGRIPVGNTGGANVPPLKPMEVPKDLKRLLEPYINS